MAKQAVPTDREAMAAMEKLKKHNAVKAKQVEAAGEKEPIQIDESLATIETWANDAPDDGTTWAGNRQAEADQQEAEATEWNDRVRADEKEAAEEAEARRNMDPEEMKQQMFKVLDDYKAALKEQADNDVPWAKDKLTEVTQEHNDAKKIIDEKLEKTLDNAAKSNAARRQKNKLVAEKVSERAKAGEEWKQEYGDQPSKYPQGQRADVKKACDTVGEWADDMIAQLQPLGAKASPRIQDLEKSKQWASDLNAQVDDAATGPQTDAQTATLKEMTLTGVEEARKAKTDAEALLAKTESEANEAMDVYTRWTDHNNKLAEQWINSDSAKHRQWAQAWLDSKK